MPDVKQHAAPKPPKARRNVLLALIAVPIAGAIALSCSMVASMQMAETRGNLVGSWLDAYGHARGKPVEVIYSQASAADCVLTMNTLTREKFFFEMDGTVVKGDALKKACEKADLHKVLLWR